MQESQVNYFFRTARRITALLLFSVITLTLAGCAGAPQIKQYEEVLMPAPFDTFRDIPGITDEEISAIENLQNNTSSLSFAMPLSIEAYIREDGTTGGYAVLLCDWLTGLFGIPFETRIVETTGQYAMLLSGEIDFSGNIVTTTPRRNELYMTDDIAVRQIVMLRMKGSPGIDEILSQRALSLAFLTDSPLEIYVDNVMPPGSYTDLWVSSLGEAYEAISTGQADACVMPGVSEVYFNDFDDVIIEEFSPLIFTQMSMATARTRPELEPVISVLNKALRSGGCEYVSFLYRQGHDGYLKDKLHSELTDSERAYIEANPVVPIGAYTTTYPVSFFDTLSNTWDGFYIDIINQVSAMTGLRFEIVNEQGTVVPDLINALRDDEVHILPDVAWTRERAEFITWSDTVLITDHYALISSNEKYDLTLNEIHHYTVGLGRDTNHAALFVQWFPEHENIIWYDNNDLAMEGLMRGEVDLMMSTRYKVLMLTHYQEIVGYKANYVFNYPIETRIAFNRSEPELISVFEKALGNIDTFKITEGWMHRTYDYRTQVAEAQRPWLIGALGLSALVIVLTIIMGITIHRRRIEIADREAQRVYEERVQFLFDTSPMGIIFIDENKKNTLVNEAVVRLLGLSSKQEYMDKFIEGVSPVYQPDGRLSVEKSEELIAKAFEEGQAVFEWVHKKPDGSLLYTEVMLVGINYKGDNVIAGYIRDLSEEKASAEKIRRTEEEKLTIDEMRQRMERLLERLPIGVVILNMEQNFTISFANKAVLDVSGRSSQEEVLGHSMLEFMPQEQADGSMTEDCLKKMYVDPSNIMELICIDKNGEEFPARFAPQRIRFGGIRSLLLVIEDIAQEFKRRQLLIDAAFKEKEANQLKNKFLAMISHEIRTPMNTILGVTEIELQNNALPKETNESFERIYESGNTLLNIINDILDLSKIEAGKMEIMPVNYDLASLINDALQDCFIRFKDKPIEFVLDVDENTPLNLYGDELRITQVLNNLLSNAFKYTDKGTVKLTVSAGTENAAIAGESVIMMFKVSDTGHGMTPQQLELLFSEFTRFHFDSGRTSTGTGIGLSITKNLLDLMDGDIHVDSEPGKGSVFTVYIPQIRTDTLVCNPGMFSLHRDLRRLSAQSPQSKKAGSVQRRQMPEGRVLIVDDISSNLYVAKGLLSPYGLHIDTARSGFEAIELIKNGKDYDIVFMDHMMPKMDGVEAARRMRGAGYKNTIVALTANALVGDSERYLSMGFDAYLSKPIDTQELNNILNRFIV